jgi:hypothetical protein
MTMDDRPLTRRRMLVLLGTAAVLPATLLDAMKETHANQGQTINETTYALCDLDLTLVDQQWNIAKRSQSVTGKPLTIAGRAFTDGVGTHATSRIVVHLDGGARRFRAFAGIDDGAEGKGSVRFSIQGDGRVLWQSGIRKKGDLAVPIDLDVSSVKWLTLHVDDAGDGIAMDHADWVEATFEGVTKAPVIVARLPEEENLFLPGRLWCDSDGQRIQAHGGGVLRHDGKWWWYGEDRSKGYVAIGVSAYVSKDLLHWKHAGVVLPRADYGEAHGDRTLCERPKVIYNPQTRKFVLWFHYDRSGYGDSRAGVAIADSPEGPFRFLDALRPIEKATFRDMNVFVDEDHQAYVFYASEDNATMHVVRLNAEWTAPQQPMIEGQTWARILVRKWREAPAPFKHGGKYYLITSGCTGWAPNAADLAVSDHPLGLYQSLGNPCVGPDADRTFGTQSTLVLPHPNGSTDDFVFLADRWKPESLSDSRYVWLPFRMIEGGAPIQWRPQWDLNSKRGTERLSK